VIQPVKLLLRRSDGQEESFQFQLQNALVNPKSTKQKGVQVQSRGATGTQEQQPPRAEDQERTTNVQSGPSQGESQSVGLERATPTESSQIIQRQFRRIGVLRVNDGPYGPTISQIARDGSAAAGGLRVGDAITTLDGKGSGARVAVAKV